MEHTISSPPAYPDLKGLSYVESNENIYRLDRTNVIVDELKSEKSKYEKTYGRYKKLHKVLFSVQLIANSTSLATGTSACGLFASGIGAVISVPFGIVSVASGIVGILFGMFDQKAMKKLKKHSQLFQLIRTTDSEILRKFLHDQVITKDEFSEILKLIEKYYAWKDELRGKSPLVGNIEKLRYEFIEEGKKLAYLEAVKRNI